jgi:hypothetical protein
MFSLQKFFFENFNAFEHNIIKPALHYDSGPMFNPNPAFLLVQKLKAAPRDLH